MGAGVSCEENRSTPIPEDGYGSAVAHARGEAKRHVRDLGCRIPRARNTDHVFSSMSLNAARLRATDRLEPAIGVRVVAPIPAAARR